MKNAFRAAQTGVSGGFFLTSRLNVYDGFAYPYGFGVHEGSMEPDLTEPIRLIRELKDEFDLPLINVTMGNPYKNPHVNRPYDHGGYIPDEHPFIGLGRMMAGVKEIQTAVPECACAGQCVQLSASVRAQSCGGHGWLGCVCHGRVWTHGVRQSQLCKAVSKRKYRSAGCLRDLRRMRGASARRKARRLHRSG